MKDTFTCTVGVMLGTSKYSRGKLENVGTGIVDLAGFWVTTFK